MPRRKQSNPQPVKCKYYLLYVVFLAFDAFIISRTKFCEKSDSKHTHTSFWIITDHAFIHKPHVCCFMDMQNHYYELHVVLFLLFFFSSVLSCNVLRRFFLRPLSFFPSFISFKKISAVSRNLYSSLSFICVLSLVPSSVSYSLFLCQHSLHC